MKLLWICDPWEKINDAHETTTRLISEAILMEHECYFCDANTLGFQNGSFEFAVNIVNRNQDRSLFLGEQSDSTGLTEYSRIFFRCDPPFDEQYYNKLRILNAESEDKGIQKKVVNSTSALLSVNSKLSIVAFEVGHIPDSLFSRDRAQLVDFLRRKGSVILKKLSKGAGEDMRILDGVEAGELEHAINALSLYSNGFQDHILIQEYIENGTEIRVWFVDHHAIACVRKIPKDPKNIFNNFDLTSHTITAREEIAINAVSQFLQSKNIRLAAVDIVDAKIIDINIGSPGLLVEMEAVLQENLAHLVIQKILR